MNPKQFLSLSLAMFLFAPGASAAFGSIVGPSDDDATYVISQPGSMTAFNGARFAFIDSDADGVFDGNEALYLQQASKNTVDALNIRIANTGGFTVGSQVREGDSDFNASLDGSFPASIDGADIGYVDADDDNAFSDGDTLVLNTGMTSFPTAVTINDTILSGPDAGTIVTNSHTLLSSTLKNSGLPIAATAFKVFDKDGDYTYTFGDAVYYDTNGGGLLTVLDVAASGSSFGRVQLASDSETVHLIAPYAFTTGRGIFKFVDSDADGVFDGNEALYLQPDSGSMNVAALDIRIANTGGFTVGSQVQEGDSDFNASLDGSFPASIDGADIGYVDADDDNAFSDGDTLVLNTGMTSFPTAVTINDTILSGPDAGTIVTNSHTLLGQPLINTGLASGNTKMKVFDKDGDGSYGTGDALFLDLDASGSVTAQDVRISGANFGHVLAFDDPEIVHVIETLGAFGGSERFVFIDSNANGVFDGNEALYLQQIQQTPNSRVESLNIRIANTGSYAAGSQVQIGDTDFNSTVDGSFPSHVDGADIGYVDADDDNAFSDGDTLVLNTGMTSFPTAVTINDTILSGPDAGTIVTNSHTLLGQPLINTGLASGNTKMKVFDKDGDGKYTHGDMVYIDVSGNGWVTVQDVRLGLNELAISPTETTSDSDGHSRTKWRDPTSYDSTNSTTPSESNETASPDSSPPLPNTSDSPRLSPTLLVLLVFGLVLALGAVWLIAVRDGAYGMRRNKR